MARRMALLLALLAALAAAPVREFLETPAAPAPCLPSGRGTFPRHWVGCAADPGATRPLASDERLALGMPVDPNRASARDLAFVPGLSRRLAAEVVADREGTGPSPTSSRSCVCAASARRGSPRRAPRCSWNRSDLSESSCTLSRAVRTGGLHLVIRCERCSTLYELDEALLAPDGSPVQCTRCDHVFTVRPPRPERLRRGATIRDRARERCRRRSTPPPRPPRSRRPRRGPWRRLPRGTGRRLHHGRSRSVLAPPRTSRATREAPRLPSTARRRDRAPRAPTPSCAATRSAHSSRASASRHVCAGSRRPSPWA